MQDYSSQKIDLYDAYDRIEESGKLDDVVKKLKKFKTLINDNSFEKQILSSEDIMSQAKFEIGKIIKRLTKIQSMLGK